MVSVRLDIITLHLKVLLCTFENLSTETYSVVENTLTHVPNDSQQNLEPSNQVQSDPTSAWSLRGEWRTWPLDIHFRKL